MATTLLTKEPPVIYPCVKRFGQQHQVLDAMHALREHLL